MTAKDKIRRNILEKLEGYGVTNEYTKAMSTYDEYRHAHWNDPISDSIGARIELQYAVALQHAGFFKDALDVYRAVATAVASPQIKWSKDKTSNTDVFYNAQVQQAVILERLGKPLDALEILDNLQTMHSLERIRDVRLAKASLGSWIDITRLKSNLVLANLTTVEALACRCVEQGDWNQQLWGRLFGAIIDASGDDCEVNRPNGSVSMIEMIIAAMGELDPPAVPWLALLAGIQFLQKNMIRALGFLDYAQRVAYRFQKFFVVAAANEYLHKCYFNLQDERRSQECLLRSISAYKRCGASRNREVRARLYTYVRELWGAENAAQILIRAENLSLLPEDFIFSRMCNIHANKRRDQLGRAYKPWEIFEDFVRDWARIRYPIGEYRHPERGKPAIDGMIVEGGQATVWQAKHVQTPADHIPPANNKLGEIARNEKVRIVRYLFVVTTTVESGWDEKFWHDQKTKQLQSNVYREDLDEIRVVLEPTLQDAVVLHDRLYDRYFRDLT